jgi:molecular chaperone GrpE
MTSEADETQVFNQPSSDDKGTYAYDHLPVEEQIAALKKNLEEARQEIDQNRDQAQRAQAELLNFRRRADEERIAQQQYSNSRLLMKLLPVVDELDLAVNHIDHSVSQHPWAEGVKLIQRKIANLLASEGVSKIDSVGAQFNPLEHEAVGTEESTKYPAGHVVEVVRNGYRLRERVIQPAQVVVAREAPQPNQAGDHNEV